MKKVLIIKNWDYPNILRQTPQGKGVWEDVKFTLDPTIDCDYVVVLNYSPKKIKVRTFPENIWCVLQEPPNEYFKYWHRANQVYFRVFTQDLSLRGERYVYSQPALPWHINKSYDELIKCSIPNKPLKLSFITSNKKSFFGQKKRIFFLEKIRNQLKFDLFGYGLNPIRNKREGLAPYRYSLAIENFSGPYYWSEKLADCFLSWTMPIYYGCTNITDYFPKDSMVSIDINDNNVIEKIKEVMESDLWIKKREAITKARDLILNKYQFFPYFADQIYTWEKRQNSEKIRKKEITIPKEDTLFHSFKLKVRYLIGSFLR